MERASTSISRVLTHHPLLYGRNIPGAQPRPAACVLGCRARPGSSRSTHRTCSGTAHPGRKIFPTSSLKTWPVLARSRLCWLWMKAPASPAPPPARCPLSQSLGQPHEHRGSKRTPGDILEPKGIIPTASSPICCACSLVFHLCQDLSTSGFHNPQKELKRTLFPRKPLDLG